ncbi:hypothetical protein [Deinococcus sp.]|uniref:hypothetical protein n=1 Tax=Deinococcus sp. TaxID=47478 RepID=UPI0025B8677F|nr:hypothetical protein [Deinococcus sp.]
MAASKPKKARPVAAALPIPGAPLPAELLTAPRTFGFKLGRSTTQPWQYWPAPVITALAAGLAYALLMRPGLNLAAEEALRVAGQSGQPLPAILSHATNAFGTFFLTILVALVMWGLGRLGTGTGQRDAKVAEVYSASFVLPLPLYLLSVLVTWLTPAAAWALSPAEVTRAEGHLLELQRAALHSAAHTPAALLLIAVSLLGTLGQFMVAYPALKETTGDAGRAARGTLLPLLPALLIQLLSIGALLVGRQS